MDFEDDEDRPDEAEAESLILREEAQLRDQPVLFPEALETAFEQEERRGNWTGERLFQRDPARYRMIVEMLGEGTISDAQIARLLKISRNTIAAVRKREKIPVEQVKEKILDNIRLGLQLTSERVVELAPTMKPRDAVIAVGVLAEKMQLLSGEATSIVGSPDRVQHASFNELIESLPVADATVVEMGSGAETAGQKAGSEAGPAEGGAGPGDSEGEARDLESPVFQSNRDGSNVSSNNFPHPSGSSPEASGGMAAPEEGGRGSAEGEGGL